MAIRTATSGRIRKAQNDHLIGRGSFAQPLRGAQPGSGVPISKLALSAPRSQNQPPTPILKFEGPTPNSPRRPPQKRHRDAASSHRRILDHTTTKRHYCFSLFVVFINTLLTRTFLLLAPHNRTDRRSPNDPVASNPLPITASTTRLMCARAPRCASCAPYHLTPCLTCT